MKSKILGFISGIFLIASLFNANAVLANKDASKESAKEKYTVMYVYMEPCRMCEDFQRRVLSDAKVKEELERFNYKKVNANRTRVPGVKLTPTVIILDEKNQEVKKWLPSLDKNDFLNILGKY